jgi:hypothetical protein
MNEHLKELLSQENLERLTLEELTALQDAIVEAVTGRARVKAPRCVRLSLRRSCLECLRILSRTSRRV